MNRFLSLGEVRLGLRLIAKQPILSLTVILALATGICLATMGFTLRDAMMNSQLPFAGGDRFVRLDAYEREGGRSSVDLPRYQLFKEQASGFAYVGAAAGRPFTLEHESGEVESIRGAFITPRTLAFLPASPIAGRALIASDGDAGAEPVVLLRDSLWRRRYGADPALVGRRLEIGGEMRTVVGVMPDTFEFPASGEVWIPLEEQTLSGRIDDVRAFGVLREGASLDALNLELDALSRQAMRAEGANREIRIRVRRYTAEPDQANIAMSALVVATVLVLVVLASNVSTLVFARTWSRAQELAVRTALGAARSRVVAQLFAETLILGTIAAAIGLGAAQVALGYMSATITGIPFWVTFEPNVRTMAFVVFLTLLVSAVSGLWPALRVTRHDLRNTLQAGRGFAFGGFGRVGASLLIVEIALSVALLNGAVTMARSLNGFEAEIPAVPHGQVLTAHMGRIPTAELRDRVVAAAAALPGVVSAGASSHLPRMFAPVSPVVVEAMDGEAASQPRMAPSVPVGAGYLEAIGAEARAGRLLVAADFATAAAPVVVVNERFVQKFLGGRNPLGRRIRVARNGSTELDEPWREIVGVVPDLGISVGDPELIAGFYAPVRDERLYYLAIRSTANPMTLAGPLRKAVAGVNPDLQLEEYLPLEEAGWDERAFMSGVASALTAMGGVALLLSIVGIYALLSFMVTRRTREIGIRVALGASSGQVVTTVIGAAAIYLAIGGALGSALGLAFIQMKSMILVSIPDPGLWTPLTIALTLGLSGAAACWVPARRALGIQPATALQAD